jgi:uncharacterized membrane protein (DUF441 family)
VLTRDVGGAEAVDGRCSPPQEIQRLLRMSAKGYGLSLPKERAAFGMTVGFSAALIGARGITYVQERRRTRPALRGFVRTLPRWPGSDDMRVHHFLPGMIMSGSCGAASLLMSSTGLERWLSVPFGAGVALAVDEIGLLTGRNNPYWGAQPTILRAAALSTVASVALAAVFFRRGAASENRLPPTAEGDEAPATATARRARTAR